MKKKYKRDRVNWKRIIFFYILFGFLLYRGALFLFTTDYLSLQKVKIDGFKVLTPSYIVEISGLKAGTNLLLINTKKIKENLLSDPWIKSAIIKKRFPHGLYIYIEERIPFCIVTDEKKGVVLSSDCIALTQNIKPFYFLRKIFWKKIDFSSIFIGKPIENKQLCDSIYIIKLFDQKFPGYLKGIEIKNGVYIKIYIKGNLTVIVGSKEDIKKREKFILLKKILERRPKGLRVLDLRYKKGIIGK